MHTDPHCRKAWWWENSVHCMKLGSMYILAITISPKNFLTCFCSKISHLMSSLAVNSSVRMLCWIVHHLKMYMHKYTKCFELQELEKLSKIVFALSRTMDMLSQQSLLVSWLFWWSVFLLYTLLYFKISTQ